MKMIIGPKLLKVMVKIFGRQYTVSLVTGTTTSVCSEATYTKIRRKDYSHAQLRIILFDCNRE